MLQAVLDIGIPGSKNRGSGAETMKPTGRQIEFLARAIVNRLEDRGLVEFGDAERGINLVIQELTSHFAVADEVERDARERLADRGVADPTGEEIEAEIQRLAEIRNLVL